MVALARNGDVTAIAALDAWHDRLTRALATLINVLDPDVIVLGGGLSRLDGIVDRVRAAWAPWVFSDRVDTQLTIAQHGDASGVRGAAWLWE